MTAPTDSTPLPEAPLALPADTTPSWEIELLISGALAFASLQLPELLDNWFLATTPRMPESLESASIMVFVFAKGIAVVLSITFVLHVMLRGFWAAGLGLQSVYPDGIKWDRVKTGPIFLRVSQETTVPLPQYVSRLDNAASIVFALGGLLLQMTLVSGIGTVVFFAGRELMIRVFGNTPGLTPLFIGLAAIPLLIVSVAGYADKQMAGRWAPDSKGPRWIEAVARISGYVFLGRFLGPMMMVFTSRLGQVRGTVIVVLLIYGAFGIVLLQALAAFGVLKLDGYRLLAERGAQVADPAHYRDQREGPLRFATVPFVSSEVASGGLLRLFVPYRIEQFDAAAERACPAAVRDATGEDTTRAAAGRDSVVACLGRLLDVRIDGTSVGPLRWLAGTDPASEFRGLLALVPIASAADGPHVVSLTRLLRREAMAKALAAKPSPPADRYEIPFWIDRTTASLTVGR